MRTIKHPLSGAIYDLEPGGTIRVTSKEGRVGVFDKNGIWLDGDVRQADPHLCLWIGGKELPNRFQQAAAAIKDDGSIPAEELTQ